MGHMRNARNSLADWIAPPEPPPPMCMCGVRQGPGSHCVRCDGAVVPEGTQVTEEPKPPNSPEGRA